MLFHSIPFHENKITFNSYSITMNTCDLSMPFMLVLFFWTRVSFPSPPWVSQPHFEASVRMRLTLSKVGIWSPLTPATSKLNSRRKNTSPWGVLYIFGKALKCRCRKWPRMNHLDICSTSYSRKKGRESNWQFDSRPQKVRNQPNPGVCRWSATHHWKALEESYKFAWDLIPIKGLSRELWAPKIPRVSIGTVLGLLCGSPGNKIHLDAGAAE